MADEQLKHLEFIQNVITRMNTNSFQIKAWAVTIVSALLAIALYADPKSAPVALGYDVLARGLRSCIGGAANRPSLLFEPGHKCGLDVPLPMPELVGIV